MNEIPLTPVTSGKIEAIGHDPETNTLAIKFKPSGSIYHYKNFTREKFVEFATAASLGSYFYKNIKPETIRHPYTKIS
jgi:hypothetical protein